ncbi:MurR/RpiR family transcriptional regulator [Bacillus sp. 1P02SD]|uniref:MurR/RpiR family transcriptional regulator n=1 Tax=Bacillus sp. 1P02SD TaxID=3132264 RepID=UPI0039A2B52F
MNKENLKAEIQNYDKLLQGLLDLRSTLPKKQAQLCDYLIENHQLIGLLTVSELAKNANVGTTTVMRFINNLGYESYLDLKKEILDASVKLNPSAWWHLQESFTDNGVGEHILIDTFTEVKDILDQTLKPSLLTNFDEAVSIMLNAERVNILGARSNKALAMYFGYLLEEFYPKMSQLSHDTEFLYDRLIRFKKGDVLLLIDNAPFTTLGVEAAEFCHKEGHPVILITDHLSSPAASYSAATLCTQASKKQYSVIPTLTILETLIIQIGRKNSNSSISNLKRLSEILEKKKITLPFSFDEDTKKR